MHLQTCTPSHDCSTSNKSIQYWAVSPNHASQTFLLETPTSRPSVNSCFRTGTAKLRSQPTSPQWRLQAKNTLSSANRRKEWRRLGSWRSTLVRWFIKSTFRYWVWMFTCFTNFLSAFSVFEAFGPMFVRVEVRVCSIVFWLAIGWMKTLNSTI